MTIPTNVTSALESLSVSEKGRLPKMLAEKQMPSIGLFASTLAACVKKRILEGYRFGCFDNKKHVYDSYTYYFILYSDRNGGILY